LIGGIVLGLWFRLAVKIAKTDYDPKVNMFSQVRRRPQIPAPNFRVTKMKVFTGRSHPTQSK
jgi:hypothetical protein